ncbi:hypothetical protein [Microbacterium sp. RURRCA19A]|uniref:hypothetical protein n=1 Tax=Microbacterium sp. RURRCA19A TaxID=1907391 RepID=UPI00111559D8|nr:hypothetical protein [Microbacterium sp. RURRCA19A]
MDYPTQGALSRRALLRVALIGAGALTGAIAAPTAASAATERSIPTNRIDTSPRPIFVGLEEVRAEYKEAVRTFPLALPQGWSFPADSSAGQTDSPSSQAAPSLWEKGFGHVEVFMYWLSAVAAAACDAHARSDNQSADELLDLLEAGFATPQRRMAIPDPENLLLGLLVDPARGGGSQARHSADFTNLRSIAHS